MSALPAVDLAAIPAGPAVTRVYLRHCFIPSSGAPDPLWVNPAMPTRWQTSGGTLYVAEDPDTVMAEHCRHNAAEVAAADPTGGFGLNSRNFAHYAPRPVGAPLVARALYSVPVAFDRLADLRTTAARRVLSAAGIGPAQLLADNFGRCPAIAQAGEALGWQAVRAQSAANLGGTALGIFAGAQPPRSDWNLEVETARPSIRVAYITRYRAGERPNWLGP